MNDIFEISDTEDYGALLKVSDVEIADELDDFLTEECYVFFEQKLESDYVEIYFGQASSSDKVNNLLRKFEAKRGSVS